MDEAKSIFEIKIKRDDNSKAFGQPVISKMKPILYDHGINRSGAFGGAIYGNYCCRLMFNANSIVGYLMDCLLAYDSKIHAISDHKIKQFRDTIIFFLRLWVAISVVC